MATIVIVDDNEIDLDVFSSALTGAGYSCIGVKEPEKALQVIIDSKPDYVLLDYMMPRMTGAALCKELKLNPLTRNIPVMFLSSTDDPDQIIATFHLGSIDFIRKPVDTVELISILHKHDVIAKLKSAWEPAKREAERIIAKYERRTDHGDDND